MAYKIVLDAGHGGEDPGATQSGRQEKDDNLKLALEVGKILQNNGVDVTYTRTTDIYQTPFQKAQIANQEDADFFISFHRNSSPMANQYSGVETLVYDRTGKKLEMAENINEELENVGFQNLGVKERPGLVVLRRTKMPALLVETGFINSEADNQLYDERFGQIAQAIADGILDTLDIEEDMPQQRPTVPQQPSMQQRPPMPPMPPRPPRPQQPPMQQQPPIPPRPQQPPMQPQPPMQQQPPMQPQPPTQQRPPMPQQPPMQQRPPMQQPSPMPTLYRVQVGLFRQRENAERLNYQLTQQGYPSYILNDREFYKVQVGAFENFGNAVLMEQRLRRDGYQTLITTR